MIDLSANKCWDANIVIFGGVGDLSIRKILPALYNIFRQGNLSEASKIFCVSRAAHEADAFQALLSEKVPAFIDESYFDKNDWARFSKLVSYVQVNLSETSQNSYKPLKEALEASQPFERIFYLSVGSFLYGPVCKGLHKTGLIKPSSRLVMEKPLGHSEASALEIRDVVTKHFVEEQVYRIDHYLGKEAVQNLLALRFGNKLFESLWSNQHIDNVQITVAETLGVGSRAGFYESVGCMRDMIQNHLLQLLTIVAMEPPGRMTSNAVRDEKIKVIRSLRPIRGSKVAENAVRGQYLAGVSQGQPVVGYREEEGVTPGSTTETFVAIKAEIDNWRWAGVPFYLRSGKRMSRKVGEIVINFKQVPHSIFTESVNELPVNSLVIELQPGDSIQLLVNGKKVGPGMDIGQMTLDIKDVAEEGAYVPEAYERLIFDCIKGQSTLFVRGDELIEAWRWVDPILKVWAKSSTSLEHYTSGTWGPASSTLLLAKDNRLWYEN